MYLNIYLYVQLGDIFSHIDFESDLNPLLEVSICLMISSSIHLMILMLVNNLIHNQISLARFYLYLWYRASKHDQTKSGWHVD